MLRTMLVCLVVAGCLPGLLSASRAGAADPPYIIVLRSRASDAVPERNRDGQVAGGYVEVVQRSPDSVLFVMRGGVVAGSEQHLPGAAAMTFELNQDFEIVPTRSGLRPPRLALAGELVGTLQSSEPEGGVGEQGPACAVVSTGGQPVVRFCLKPHQVASCQKLFVNDREGAHEAVVVPGGYCLQQSFAIRANAPVPSRPFCPRVIPGVSVVFDPDPKVETRYTYVLNAFRNLPRSNFGFTVLLNVSEELPAVVGPAILPEPLRKAPVE